MVTLFPVASYAQFDDLDPIQISTKNGNNYKFTADFIEDRGDNPSVLINLDSNNTVVNLTRGEAVNVTHGVPFGSVDNIQAILLKGNVSFVDEQTVIGLNGVQNEFYHDSPHSSSMSGFEAKIPNNMPAGNYKLVIIIESDAEVSTYYITDAKVNAN